MNTTYHFEHFLPTPSGLICSRAQGLPGPPTQYYPGRAGGIKTTVLCAYTSKTLMPSQRQLRGNSVIARAFERGKFEDTYISF